MLVANIGRFGHFKCIRRCTYYLTNDTINPEQSAKCYSTLWQIR
jgi:hypothetical protein